MASSRIIQTFRGLSARFLVVYEINVKLRINKQYLYANFAAIVDMECKSWVGFTERQKKQDFDMCTIKLKERDNHLAVKVLNERKRDNQNTRKTEGLMRTEMRETHKHTTDTNVGRPANKRNTYTCSCVSFFS